MNAWPVVVHWVAVLSLRSSLAIKDLWVMRTKRPRVLVKITVKGAWQVLRWKSLYPDLQQKYLYNCTEIQHYCACSDLVSSRYNRADLCPIQNVLRTLSPFLIHFSEPSFSTLDLGGHMASWVQSTNAGCIWMLTCRPSPLNKTTQCRLIEAAGPTPFTYLSNVWKKI